MAYFKHGSWNAVCDVCGFRWKAELIKERWDSLRTCPECFELRNPLDLIRTPLENTTVPYQRPEQGISDYFTCTYSGSQGLAGVGVAGCARAGTVNY